MASITFDHVSKRFGDVTVLYDLTLTVHDEEFLVLVGPSGCGKSTALRCLAGLEDVSDGQIYIGDRLVTDVAPGERNIAMVFQNYALYPHMSVYENMAFALRLRAKTDMFRKVVFALTNRRALRELRETEAAIDHRVRETARLLSIDEFLHRKPRALSGGQRQRVALGRAIVRNPAVFLMDEPLSNLDARLRVQTRTEISKLHQRLKTTFIYVTHDQTEAMTMGNRIAVMNQGILQQHDTPQHLYDHPRNVFVAGFIGSPAMNIVPARIEQSDYGLAVALADSSLLSIPRARAPLLEHRIGRPVWFGIRPEDIHDAHYLSPGVSDAIQLRARVTVLERMGSEVFAYLEHSGVEFVGRFDSRTAATMGATVDVVLNMEKMHVFDWETEMSLL